MANAATKDKLPTERYEITNCNQMNFMNLMSDTGVQQIANLYDCAQVLGMPLSSRQPFGQFSKGFILRFIYANLSLSLSFFLAHTNT